MEVMRAAEERELAGSEAYLEVGSVHAGAARSRRRTALDEDVLNCTTAGDTLRFGLGWPSTASGTAIGVDPGAVMFSVGASGRSSPRSWPPSMGIESWCRHRAAVLSQCA